MIVISFAILFIAYFCAHVQEIDSHCIIIDVCSSNVQCAFCTVGLLFSPG